MTSLKNGPDVTQFWRPSRALRKRCDQLDRYYKKCQKVANGHHSEYPFMKRYNWLVSHDYGRSEP